MPLPWALNLDSKTVLVCFDITIMTNQKLDDFIEQRGLFCLIVLRPEAEGLHLETDLLLTESQGSMLYYTEQDREGRHALIMCLFI